MIKTAQNRGQALVIILLSLSVVLTLVLFILSRSITDIAVTTSGEDAMRAFSAAEAGVEKALIVGSSSNSQFDQGASFDATVSELGEGLEYFNYPINLGSGDSATIWFAGHDAQGVLGNNVFSGKKIRICWGKPGSEKSLSSVTPAIEVSVFYNDTVAKIGRVAFDPNSDGRSPQNNFTKTSGGTCDIQGVDYAFRDEVHLDNLTGDATSGLVFARVRMMYNTDQNHPVGFDTSADEGGDLPSQGLEISSTGKSGGANRRLEVFQGWPEVPGVFDGAVFSATGLTKG